MAGVQGPTLFPPLLKHVKEVRGDREFVYTRDGDEFVIPGDDDTLWDRLKNLTRSGIDKLIPKNYPDSVSKDYAPTRRWAIAHDIFTNVANFGAGAAFGAALGISPMWSGAGMAFFNMYKDDVCQLAGLGFAQYVPAAERKARPWALAGEILEKVGTLVTCLAAVMPSGPGWIAAGALLGLGIGTGLIGGFAGAMKGGGTAEIGPRQAPNGNLGDVGAKNGCQWIVANLAVATPAIVLLERYIAPMLGTGTTNAALALVGGLAAILCQGQFVKHLDYHPINEETIRKMVHQESAPPVEKKVWRALYSLMEPEKIKVGESMQPLLADSERFDQLRAIYRDRNYMMEWSEGKSRIVLREHRLQDGDKPTQLDHLLAVVQAAHAEKLAQSQEYEVIRQDKGQVAADRWVVQKSLERTPDDSQPMLDDLAKAGWSADALRFNDCGFKGTW